jgi:hypothetical protein
MSEVVRSPSYCVLYVAPDDGQVSEAERVVRSVAPSIRRVPPDRLIDVVRGDPTVSIAIISESIATGGSPAAISVVRCTWLRTQVGSNARKRC